MPLTYSAPAVDITLKIIRSYGINPIPIMRKLRIDPEKLRDPHARFRYAQIDDLWALAVAKANDPAFGLKAAEFWHPSQLGALGYAWLASASLRTALNRMVRYIRILTEGATLKLQDGGDELSLVLNYKRISKQQPTRTDSFMAMLLAMCQADAGMEFHPTSISLTHPAPEDTAPFFALFGCPVNFSSKTNSFNLSREWADLELPGSNPQLVKLNDQVMVEYIASLGDDNIIERVKVQIMDQLPSGKVSDESVAEALFMNSRTLQRRLQKEDITFKTILTEVRMDLADSYLLEHKMALSEISFLLGFAELSSFSRAFKRWTGESPLAYRG